MNLLSCVYFVHALINSYEHGHITHIIYAIRELFFVPQIKFVDLSYLFRYILFLGTR